MPLKGTQMANIAASTSCADVADPFRPLIHSIGAALSQSTGTKRLSAAATRKISQALHHSLEENSLDGRCIRLLLLKYLVDVEARSCSPNSNTTQSGADALISTTEAAKILGYSRPYVVMLLDQQQLPVATISSGGHRRVSRAAVMEWKRQQSVGATSLRTSDHAADFYATSEADVTRRLKSISTAKRR